MNRMDGRANGPADERPRLKAMVREASQALTALNAVRLQELAAACSALAPQLANEGEASEAAAELAVLSRVLKATRANAEVMHRLRQLRADRIEYSEQQARGSAAESVYGHD